MTKQEKLEKIIRDCYPENYILGLGCELITENKEKKIGTHLGLAEVLWAIDPFGNWGCVAGYISKIDRISGTYDFKIKWDLTKDLDHQSPEVHRFLYDIFQIK